MFRVALFTIVEIQKQLKCPLTDKWIKMCTHTHTHTHTHTLEYYSAIKKNENLPTTWMDLEYIIPSEISQTEKNK